MSYFVLFHQIFLIYSILKNVYIKEVVTVSLQDVMLLIQSISGHPCRKGYYHLALAVYYCCQVPVYSGICLERQIYPLISNEINLPVRSISRSISRAVCDCWDYGNRTNLDKVANRHLIEKPSPKELIIYLCSYLAGYPDLI